MGVGTPPGFLGRKAGHCGKSIPIRAVQLLFAVKKLRSCGLAAHIQVARPRFGEWAKGGTTENWAPDVLRTPAQLPRHSCGGAGVRQGVCVPVAAQQCPPSTG